MFYLFKVSCNRAKDLYLFIIIIIIIFFFFLGGGVVFQWLGY